MYVYIYSKTTLVEKERKILGKFLAGWMSTRFFFGFKDKNCWKERVGETIAKNEARNAGKNDAKYFCQFMFCNLSVSFCSKNGKCRRKTF